MTIQAVVTHSPFVVRRRTAGDSFDLIARQETMSQTLLIPGLSRLNPNTLFADGQPGGWADPYDLTRMWIDDAGTTPATIASLGTGIGRVITKGGPAITLTQANAADRPVWGRHPVSGLRNIVLNSEFNGSGPSPTNWALALSTGVSRAVVASTSGFTNAYQAETANTAGREVLIQSVSLLANSTYTVSFTIEAVVGQPSVVGAATALPAGAVSGSVSNPASTGVYSYQITTLATGGTADIRMGINVLGTNTGNASVVRFSGIQIELSATRTTYQRVTNRFDVTEVGSPSLYYFSGNGVNQRWSSNATVNFSGTDKVTVWAGAQRLSNAARGTIVELTSSIASNNGAFHMTGPNAASDTFGWESKGTTLRDAVATVALGNRRSLVGVADISGDLARLIVDGTATDNTGDQGTGNYSNATLHVFSRGGSSQFFNGRLYSLIIAGGLYDSRTIARFADWTLKPRRLITA